MTKDYISLSMLTSVSVRTNSRLLYSNAEITLDGSSEERHYVRVEEGAVHLDLLRLCTVEMNR